MPNSVAPLLVLALFTAHGARGQSPVGTVPLDSGTLIRMTPRQGDHFEGRLVERFPAAGTSLYVCRYPGRPCVDPQDSTAMRRVQVASLLGIEVQRGTHAAKGAATGGVIGVALGFLVGSFARGLCESQDCVSGANAAPFEVGLVGAGIGAVFGWASPRWSLP